MKKLITMCLLFCFLTSCQNKNWEYHTLFYYPEKQQDNFKTNEFKDPNNLLNDLGKQNWELISTYSELETVYPNFGNDEYVTGIQSNTRTSKIVFIFKRMK